MKIIKSAALILAAVLALTACNSRSSVTVDGSSGVSSADSSSNSSETFLDRASKFLEADGRDYGKEHTAEIGETLDNEFFSLKVTETYRYSSMGDYVPNDGFDFVAVNITVKNIFSDVIPVGTYDYVLRWGEGDDNSFKAYETDDLLIYYDMELFPDDVNLSIGASRSGYVIFEAPTDSTELMLEYVEVYDDDFEGNTYRINLGNPEFAADDFSWNEDYDEITVTGEVGEIISTNDYDLCINSVSAADSFGGYTAYDGYELITADITLTGTAAEDISVGASMFYIIFTAFDEEYGDYDEFYDYSIDSTDLSADAGFFPEIEVLTPGGTINGTVLFEIPEDSTDAIITLAQYSSDGSTEIWYEIPLGNVFGNVPSSI